MRGWPKIGFWIGVAVALMGAASNAAPAQADTEKRVALVIGNAGYQNVPRLANSAADAQLVAKTLQDLGFKLVGGGAQLNLDHAGFARAVQQFGDAIADSSVALFYYAGHGIQMQGENYLVPTDANPIKPSDADFQLIATSALLHVMRDSGSRLNLVILDACRNNPFGGRGLRDLGSGLAQMQAPKGTLVSYATQPGNVALDGPPGGNGPYAKALAEAMRMPGLDVLQTFNRVGLIVARATQDQQEPWQSSSPVEGSFFFVPGMSDETKRARDDAEQARAEAEAAKAQAQAEAAELAKAKAEAEQARAEAAAAKAQVDAQAGQAKLDTETARKQAGDALAQAQAEAARARDEAKAAQDRAAAAQAQAQAQAQAETSKALAEAAKTQRLAAAAPSPAPASPPLVQPAAITAAPSPGACPALGTEIRTSKGVTLRIEKVDGFLCGIRIADPLTQYTRYGLLINTDDPAFSDGQAEIAGLWPLAVGKQASFSSSSDAYHSSDTHSIKVERQERITVAAGTFDVFVVTDHRHRVKLATGQGSTTDTVDTLYISPELGFEVKHGYEVILGTRCSNCGDWEAIQITPPAGATVQAAAAVAPIPAPAPAVSPKVEPAAITSGPTPGAYAKAPAPGACPMPGTEITLSNGTKLRVEQANGVACVTRDLHYDVAHTIRGLLLPDYDDAYDEGKDEIARLWPLEVGKSAHYASKHGDFAIYGNVDRHSLEVVRKDRIAIGLGSFDVYVVTDRWFQSTGAGRHQLMFDRLATYYISTDLGYPVRADYLLLDGGGCLDCANWEVTAITPPK